MYNMIYKHTGDNEPRILESDLADLKTATDVVMSYVTTQAEHGFDMVRVAGALPHYRFESAVFEPWSFEYYLELV